MSKRSHSLPLVLVCQLLRAAWLRSLIPTTRSSGYHLAIQTVAIVAVSLVVTLTAGAQTFTRIVHSSTPVPDGVGEFQMLVPMSAGGSSIVFLGEEWTNGQSGIYRAQVGGPLERIVDQHSRVPNHGSNFGYFNGGHEIESGIAFLGSYPVNGEWTNGYFLRPNNGGSLVTLVDRDTQLPNGQGASQIRFYDPNSSDSTFAFSANDGVTSGIFAGDLQGGPLATIALHGTAIPHGSGDFSQLFGPTVADATVIFSGRADHGADGLYAGTLDGSPLRALVAENTRMPGSDQDFHRMYPTGHSETLLTFVGDAVDGHQGAYAIPIDGSGLVQRIADTSTAIPQGNGNFTNFTGVALSGSRVALLADGEQGQTGIYLGSLDGGPLSKLLAANDLLDGRSVSYLSFPYKGLDRNLLAFYAGFSDGTFGIYAADLSAPGDTNGDGVVDLTDLNNVRNNFGGTGLGDTNADGVVDLEDLNTVRNHFGATNGASAVPEPSTALLLALGAIAIAVQRPARRAAIKRTELAD